MSASALVIPELEQAIRHGSNERRAQMLKRIAGLFADGASQFNADHVDLFGDILRRFASEVDAKARAELSRCLAPIGNAPAKLMRTLATDDDISVAGPVLTRSAALKDIDLVDIAGTKSQAHLAAMAARDSLGEAVTDVLVQRGDAQVLQSLADNPSAGLSEKAFAALVRRAAGDDGLAETVGRRRDIPAPLFRDLLVRATADVQQRLLATVRSDAPDKTAHEPDNVSVDIARAARGRDYSVAQRAVLEMQKAGKLGETELAGFANDKKYEETIAALSLLCGVSIEVADRLMTGDRPDPVLILCKATGYGWPTVRSVIMARPGARSGSAQMLEAAFRNFEKLSTPTAQRVVRFWQTRQPDGSA